MEAERGVAVCGNVLPHALADKLLDDLKALPEEAWQLEETRQGQQHMRFFRLKSQYQWQNQADASLAARLQTASRHIEQTLEVVLSLPD